MRTCIVMLYNDILKVTGQTLPPVLLSGILQVYVQVLILFDYFI